MLRLILRASDSDVARDARSGAPEGGVLKPNVQHPREERKSAEECCGRNRRVRLQVRGCCVSRIVSSERRVGVLGLDDASEAELVRRR